MIGYERLPRLAEAVNRFAGEESEISPPGILWEVDRPEHQFLHRTKIWGAVAAVGASALHEGLVAIVNPTGSKRLVVITGGNGVLASQASVPGIRKGMNLATATQVAGIFTRDTRWPDPGPPVAQIWTNNTQVAAGGSPLGAVRRSVVIGAVNTDFYFDFPIVLAPGWNAGIAAAIVNIAFDHVAFWGYERPAREEEIVE